MLYVEEFIIMDVDVICRLEFNILGIVFGLVLLN